MSTLNPYIPPAAKPKYQTTLQRSIEEQRKAAKEAAEKAAAEYGCTGAHRMGKKWMPCSMH